MPNFTQDDIDELEELGSLIEHPGIKYVRSMVAQRKIGLINDCHVRLARHEDRKAGEFLERSKEVDHIFVLIKDRIAELNNKINNR